MDPLSVTASVAGIATAGTAIASALFKVISDIRDAPKEIKDIAFGVQDLSRVLKELHSTLRRGRKLFKERLFRSVRSAIGRINDLHEDIYELLEASAGSLGRLLWTFRRSKTSKLLAEVEAHKTTVGLMASTMLLAIKERKFTKMENERMEETREEERERRRLRREAENMVQMTNHRMQDLQPPQTQEDKGTQTEPTLDSSNDPNMQPIGSAGSTPAYITDDKDRQAGQRPTNQLERWHGPFNDTATWLYRLVFDEDQLSLERGSDFSVGERGSETALEKMSSFGRMVDYHRILSRLLSQWTTLTVYEIESTEDHGNDDQDPWENRLSEAVELLRIEPEYSDEETSTEQANGHDSSSFDEAHRLNGHVRPMSPASLNKSGGRESRDSTATSPMERSMLIAQKMKLATIEQEWNTTWIPHCRLFLETPPLDNNERGKEHRRLAESILQRVLLRLDEVDPGDSMEVRDRRKDLVQEAQHVLSTIDATNVDARPRTMSLTPREPLSDIPENLFSLYGPNAKTPSALSYATEYLRRSGMESKSRKSQTSQPLNQAEASRSAANGVRGNPWNSTGRTTTSAASGVRGNPWTNVQPVNPGSSSRSKPNPINIPRAQTFSETDRPTATKPPRRAPELKRASTKPSVPPGINRSETYSAPKPKTRAYRPYDDYYD